VNSVRVVSSLLGVSPASEFCIPTFRNHLSVPSSTALKVEQIDGSETSACKNQTPGIHPKDYSQYSKHGKRLKSRICESCLHKIEFFINPYPANVENMVSF
jgi:hypothetical protein